MANRTLSRAPDKLEVERLDSVSQWVRPPGKSLEWVLDVGCGANKISGAIGVDRRPSPEVDVVSDLDCFPWPFANDSFDRAICRHSLAHMASVVRAMEELHRILRPGGVLEIVSPHFSSDNAFTDVTSRWFFSSRSMEYFCTNGTLKYRYGKCAFELLEKNVSFCQAARFNSEDKKANPFQWFGVEWLVNRFPRLYEHFFAFILRANEVYFRLRVVK